MSDEKIPSYEEAAQSAHLNGVGPPAPSFGLQIANIQHERVYAIARMHIQQFLQSHLQTGLSKMVYALIPSDSESLGALDNTLPPMTLEKCQSGQQDYLTHNPAEQIVNIGDDDYVRSVRLQGPENVARFWQQPPVIEILRKAVCEILGVVEHEPALEHALPARNLVTMSKKERREFESAKSVGTLGHGIGWRSSGKLASPRPSETAVQVGVGDISIRRATEIGLYETRTISAIVVRVHVH